MNEKEILKEIKAFIRDNNITRHEVRDLIYYEICDGFLEAIINKTIQLTQQKFISIIDKRIEDLKKLKFDPFMGGYTDKYTDGKIIELTELKEELESLKKEIK
jgi:hypothetical protein